MWSFKKCEAEAFAEKEMSEDIFSAKIKCEQCEYNTDTYIPKESTVTEKIQLECGTNDFETTRRRLS